MNNINNIPKRGTWSESTSKIDQNFKIFEDELNHIEDDAQKCKGLFPSLSSLVTKFPSPAIGSWAYVGDRLPALIYIYKSGGWESTGKTGGGDFNPSIYANSVAIDNVEDLFSTRDKWISGYNGGNWTNVESGKIKLSTLATSYTVRLSSLAYQEVGELLERTLTDPYLYTFGRGSFVSLNLTSSDGVSRDYTENYLSWTIDNTFYKKTIGGQTQNRLPVEGDMMSATLRFKVPNDSETKIKRLSFKFTL